MSSAGQAGPVAGCWEKASRGRANHDRSLIRTRSYQLHLAWRKIAKLRAQLILMQLMLSGNNVKSHRRCCIVFLDTMHLAAKQCDQCECTQNDDASKTAALLTFYNTVRVLQLLSGFMTECRHIVTEKCQRFSSYKYFQVSLCILLNLYGTEL